MELFADAGPEHLAIGEGSVFYLYSSSALAAIREFNPSARLIVMIRNPVDFVQSLHSEFLVNRNESEQSFEAAWNLQDKRREGRSIPRNLKLPVDFLMYRDMGMISEALSNVMSLFPQPQVKILLLEDLARDPGDVYRQVLDYLEIPDDGRTEFARINANKQARVPALMLATRHAPKSLSGLLNKNKRTRDLKNQLIQWLDGFNLKPTERTDLRTEFRADLTAIYSQEVARLSDLLDRDLSSWLSSE
jgi:hypothetical protein